MEAKKRRLESQEEQVRPECGTCSFSTVITTVRNRVTCIKYTMSATFCDFTQNGNSGFITYAKIGRCTLPVDVRNNAIFHAGPIIRPLEHDKFEMVSVGPTTSMRMEKFEYEFVKETGVRVIIGKGGMKENTERACKEFGPLIVSIDANGDNLLKIPGVC
jgi:hypothetical protein